MQYMVYVLRNSYHTNKCECFFITTSFIQQDFTLCLPLTGTMEVRAVDSQDMALWGIQLSDDMMVNTQ